MTPAGQAFPDLQQYRITGSFVSSDIEVAYSKFRQRRWLPRFHLILFLIALHQGLMSICLVVGWGWCVPADLGVRPSSRPPGIPPDTSCSSYPLSPRHLTPNATSRPVPTRYPNTNEDDNLALRSGLYDLRPWTAVDHLGLTFMTWNMFLASFLTNGFQALGAQSFLARNYREVATLWLVCTILIFTLPAVSVEGSFPQSFQSPALRDATCKTLESAAASFASNYAFGQTPTLIAINVVPFRYPVLWTALLLVLSWMRAKSLYFLAFNTAIPFTLLKCITLFFACCLVAHVSASHSRALFIVATTGARRVRQLEGQLQQHREEHFDELRHIELRTDHAVQLALDAHQRRLEHAHHSTHGSSSLSRSLSF